MAVMLNMGLAQVREMAKLLYEAAAVLTWVREAHPDVWENYQPRDYLVDELGDSANQLREAGKP